MTSKPWASALGGPVLPHLQRGRLGLAAYRRGFRNKKGKIAKEARCKHTQNIKKI